MPTYMKDPRKPTKMTQLVDQIIGPGGISGMPAVSIGPKAIPLADEDSYIRQVISSVLGDLGQAFNKPFAKMYPGAKNILGNVRRDPALYPKAAMESMAPGIFDLSKNPGTYQDPEMAKQMLNRLIEAFHPTYMPGDK